MRNKLALIIALASFAAVTALGAGIAGASSVSGIGNGLTVDQVSIVSPISTARTPTCTNGVDDDRDELVDGADPDC